MSVLSSKRAGTQRGFRQFPSPPNSNHFLLMSVSLLSLHVQSQPRKTSNAPASFVVPSHGLDCSLAARHCWGKKRVSRTCCNINPLWFSSQPLQKKLKKTPTTKKKTQNKTKKEAVPQNPYVLFKGTRVSSEHAFWTLSWTCVWGWW